MTLINQGKEFELLNKSLTPIEEPIKTGLKLPGDIVLGDFVFNTIDEFGVIWVITNIEGWWNPPSAEMPDITRGYGDGSYDFQGRYEARELSLEGVFLTKDPSLVEAARDRLIEATNLVYKGAWLITGTDPKRASFVRLSGDIEIETTNARGRTEFSIGLRAADPIKYEWNDSEPDGYTVVEILGKNLVSGESGVQIINNIGNYDVPVYLEVVGPVTSPATIFNRTREELILMVSGIRGRLGSVIDNKELTLVESSLEDIATLTTRTAHNFQQGDEVVIEGVDAIFDGSYIIATVPSATTFTYKIENVSDTFSIVQKSLFNNLAKIETSEPHAFNVNDFVFVSGVDSVFNGTYRVAAKTLNTFSFAKTRNTSASISGVSIISNQANVITVDPHNFILGERVTISGINSNYNGSYLITSVPSPTTFTYAVTRTNSRAILNRVISSNVATITLNAPHGFVNGEDVLISGLPDIFDGIHQITSLPANNTFTYNIQRSTSKNVTVKSRSSNIAIITTSTSHGLSASEQVTISGVDGFNGTFTVTAVLSSNSFSFSQTGSNLNPTSVTNGKLVVNKRLTSKRKRQGNVATLTTATAHGLFVGEVVNIEGVETSYNGNSKIITSIPTSNSFTYASTGADEAEVNSGGLVSLLGSYPVLPSSTDIVGYATVSGSLPFTSVSATATVENYVGTPISGGVEPIVSSGRATKKNEVPFTPGVSISSTATATYGPDLLEIDTLNRDVFLNGEIEGARAKIDILADFIKLSPGENIIEFEDSGNPASDALLKIYYRSGWLG
jgi:DNA/RNA endonuclease YhcR with UshA esterase domain